MAYLLKQLQQGYQRAAYGVGKETAKTHFYELTDRATADGAEVSMSAFRGSVLCVVNVASK